MKNFLSVGNIVQAVNLDTKDITLVLGENLDLGGNDNRNGCGKTTILNALSYVLFGEPLTKIKMNNLINKSNGKNMSVSVTFERDGESFFIERGRKPDIFVLNKNGNKNEESEGNEAQGENKITQEEINEILGFNHLMFKHIVALNTYTVPFLSSTAGDQREIIETLLGVLALSSKAENLKTKIKDTKQLIKDEETSIQTMLSYNDMVLKNVVSLTSKYDTWETSKQEKLDTLGAKLESLTLVDIEHELTMHDMIETLETSKTTYNNIKKDLTRVRATLASKNQSLNSYISKCTTILTSKRCPECSQELHVSHDDLLSKYETEITSLSSEIDALSLDESELTKTLDSMSIPDSVVPSTVYATKKAALVHDNNITVISKQIEELLASSNPYQEQIDNLNAEMKEPDYSNIDALNSLKDHQEFLLKLLTNKDSFVRKKIITQNIAFLNSRLSHYLLKVGLHHNVVFMSDLEVEITYLGKDLDFDNLSRGERTRLILALSWAFRDVYEGLNASINVMFVDELIDTGLDPQGVESSLSILKDMVRSTHKSIFLISHRDELIGRVDTTLKVIKENGFTSFEY